MKNFRITYFFLLCIACTCLAPIHAQESCYEQYLREHNKKILTAEDADDSYDELKKTVLARQMYGDSYLLMVDTIAQRVMITKVDGTYIADVHVALVDSTWYMWLSVDPLADKNIANSPYLYCNGNPIMLVDPDGRDLEIIGDEATSGFKQLQAATHIKLKMDENGTVSRIGGIAWTKADRALYNVLQDHNVLVTLKSVNTYFTDGGLWFAGGAFGGSRIESDGRIHTLQYLNPNDMAKIDLFSETKIGVGALHEVLESYYGGIILPGCDNPTYDTSTPEYDAYLRAHRQAEAADWRHNETPLYIDNQNGILYKLYHNIEIVLHQDERLKVK